MLEPSKLSLFCLSALILLLTPGPAVLYIITRSANQGRLAGLVSVLSIETGNFFHVLAAAFGLSALLVSSALAFSVVKYLGAFYLIFLGLRKLIVREAPDQSLKLEHQSLRSIFTQGVMVAMLNPKTALFFFAFLPQFVDYSSGSAALQMLTLGCIFVLMAIISDGLYALLASALGQRLKRIRFVGQIERYLVGSVYLALGLTAALSGNGKK